MKSPDARRVAKNFIDKHGKDGLRKLFKMLNDGVALRTIAVEFDVTHERVRQWRDTLGNYVVVKEYHPYDEVIDEAGIPLLG